MRSKINCLSRLPWPTAHRSAALICSALILAGCAAMNLQAYSGARRPLGQVAKLWALEAQILSVDGVPLTEQCGGRMKDCNILLLPGMHSMRVQPLSLKGGEGPGYIAPTAATPGMYIASSSYYLPVGDPVTVRYAVLADHKYSLITDRNCIEKPADMPPQARSKPTDKGLCLVDVTAGKVVHSQ